MITTLVIKSLDVAQSLHLQLFDRVPRLEIESLVFFLSFGLIQLLEAVSLWIQVAFRHLCLWLEIQRFYFKILACPRSEMQIHFLFVGFPFLSLTEKLKAKRVILLNILFDVTQNKLEVVLVF